MALAIDASTPLSKAIVGSATSQVSNTFSPPAGSVVVLMVSVGAAAGSSQSVASVTDSLAGHLTWGLINGPTDGTGGNINARENVSIGGGVTGATAEMWYASCPSAQTNMTVTPTFAQAALSGGGQVAVAVLTGADTTQSGAVGVATNSTNNGTFTHAITTTRNGSLCVACGINWNQAFNAVPGTNQTLAYNGNNFIQGNNYWAQRENALTTNSGTSVTQDATFNATTANLTFNGVFVELLAATGGAPPIETVPFVLSQAAKRASYY